MKTIHKYTLALVDRQRIDVPEKSCFISAQIQSARICVWAIVETDHQTESVQIVIVGTGQPMPADREMLLFIGTVQQGAMVWHIFRVVK